MGEQYMSFEEFRQMISEISNVPLEKICKDSSFRDDLDIDSLQMVNLIVELTTRLGFDTFKIQENSDLNTVWSLFQMMIRQGTSSEQLI